MLVEIQYKDYEGAICPFCGTRLSYMEVDKMHQIIGYTCRITPCKCAQHHLVFIIRESITNDDGYDVYIRAFAHYQDWEDHVDMSITAGAYVIPHLDDEDDAWTIHCELIEKEKEDAKNNSDA